jgi:hypothetical protein
MNSRVPYYSTPERQAAFVAEARSWLGTPFRENCCTKGAGGGVDCVRFALAVHVACGACDSFEVETLPVEFVRNWHVHHTESRVFDFFHQPGVRARLRRIDEDDQPIIGDMVAVKIDQCVHHLGLFCGPEVLHVGIHGGVMAHSIHHPDLKKHIVAYYRIFEP